MDKGSIGVWFVIHYRLLRIWGSRTYPVGENGRKVVNLYRVEKYLGSGYRFPDRLKTVASVDRS